MTVHHALTEGLTRQLATTEKLGCCRLVLCTLLEVMGYVPSNVPMDSEDWLNLAPPGAQSAGLVASGLARWSAILNACTLLNEPVRVELDITRRRPPAITAGRWHIVQRWSEGYGRGHTFWVWGNEDGTVDTYESSTDRGFRVTRGLAWPGPEAGYMLCVLTLPAGS